jgi:two-component system, OmpR family, phosphate regulon response regulator PhoB
VDWTLSRPSGSELLENLRRQSTPRRVPVIVVTSSSDETQILRVFDLGADGVVSRPFSVKEFVARVEALLRRHARTESPAHPADVLVAGDIELDRNGMRVRRRGKSVELDPIDYRLLELFVQNTDRVLSHDEILDSV